MDILFYNGKVKTLDHKDQVFEAIGVKDGKIQFLGNNEDASKENASEKIDLKGKLMLPGFVDAHMHAVNYAFVESSVKLFDVTSVDEAYKRASSYVKTEGENKIKWVYARGWNEDNFKIKKYPEKKELDKISLTLPIMMVRVCGHIAVCNTCTLERMKKLPEFESLKNDINFETGLVREGAVQIFYSILEKPSQEFVENLMKLSMTNLNKAGITGCQPDDFSSLPGNDWELIVNSYKDLEKKSEMTVRIYQQCLFERADGFKKFLAKGYRTGQGGDFYKIGPLKLLQDGSLGARSAAMLEDYEGNPGNRGIAIFSQEELDEITELAHKNKMQIAVHGIGDRAIDMIIKSLKRANEKNPRADHRHGIVHAQITNQRLLDEMKANNIIAYIQPVFVGYDMDITEDRIGAKRMDKVYAWKTMLDMGILAVGGSDAPVESFDIIENIHFAVTREKLNGKPEGGWLPKEKLSTIEAVKLFTTYPSFSAFAENETGTLEVGKFADMVILSEDILETEPSNIKNIKVEMTVSGGRIVYKK